MFVIDYFFTDILNSSEEFMDVCETKLGMRLLTDTLNIAFFCSKIYIIHYCNFLYS